MKRLIILALWLYLTTPLMAQYTHVVVPCSQGGKVLATPVMSSGNSNNPTNLVGNYPLATVTVYDTGTVNLSTLYSTSGGAALGNPTVCTSTGQTDFYVGTGTYDITFSGNANQTQLVTPFTVGALFVPATVVPSVGNGTTVIDLTDISGYAAKAAADAAALYAEGITACIATRTCAKVTGIGLPCPSGTYPWTTLKIANAVELEFPDNCFMFQTVDHNLPWAIVERGALGGGALAGTVSFKGQGHASQVGSSTRNSGILVRADDNSLMLKVQDLTVVANGAGCGPGTAIELDAGLPNLQRHQAVIQDSWLYGRFAFRENTSYINYLRNVEGGSCNSIDLEGGNTVIDNLYVTNLGSGLINSIQWLGSQWMPGERYTLNAAMWLRNSAGASFDGNWYKATVDGGVTGSSLPAGCSTPACTFADGTQTWTLGGRFAPEWWPNYTYPANSHVIDISGQCGMDVIFKTTAGGVSGYTTTPTWNCAVGNTTSDGTITWTSLGAINDAPGADPPTTECRSCLFEINTDGPGILNKAGSLALFNSNVALTQNTPSVINYSELFWAYGLISHYKVNANGFENVSGRATLEHIEFQGPGSGTGIGFSNTNCYPVVLINPTFANWGAGLNYAETNCYNTNYTSGLNIIGGISNGSQPTLSPLGIRAGGSVQSNLYQNITPYKLIGGATPAFTISGCSATGPVGSGMSGEFTSGTTGTCTVVITQAAPVAAPAANKWYCSATDITSGVVLAQTAGDTTSCTVSGTTNSGDTIMFAGTAH